VRIAKPLIVLMSQLILVSCPSCTAERSIQDQCANVRLAVQQESVSCSPVILQFYMILLRVSDVGPTDR
jgi:hypothetical protein